MSDSNASNTTETGERPMTRKELFRWIYGTYGAAAAVIIAWNGFLFVDYLDVKRQGAEIRCSTVEFQRLAAAQRQSTPPVASAAPLSLEQEVARITLEIERLQGLARQRCVGRPNVERDFPGDKK